MISGSWSSSANQRSYEVGHVPLAANTADFTFAVQPCRTVEFMVKPEVGAKQLELPAEKK
jgi:hypothetical protein